MKCVFRQVMRRQQYRRVARLLRRLLKTLRGCINARMQNVTMCNPCVRLCVKCACKHVVVVGGGDVRKIVTLFAARSGVIFCTCVRVAYTLECGRRTQHDDIRPGAPRAALAYDDVIASVLLRRRTAVTRRCNSECGWVAWRELAYFAVPAAR